MGGKNWKVLEMYGKELEKCQENGNKVLGKCLINTWKDASRNQKSTRKLQGKYQGSNEIVC